MYVCISVRVCFRTREGPSRSPDSAIILLFYHVNKSVACIKFDILVVDRYSKLMQDEITQ